MFTINKPPKKPPYRSKVLHISDALLTPTTKELRNQLNIKGCVYNKLGSVVNESVRDSRRSKWFSTQNPHKINPKLYKAEFLRGSWLYMGNWINHFGHYLLETITTLWPYNKYNNNIKGIIYHDTNLNINHPVCTDIFKYVVNKTIPLIRVPDSGLRVEKLIVPTRSFAIHSYALPEAKIVWNKISNTINHRPSKSIKKVFLSRSKVNSRKVKNDKQVDNLFRQFGFKVIHPEKLTLEEQVRIVSNAKVIAGPSGSNLHLTSLNKQNAHIIELGYMNGVPNPSQRCINHIRGHKSIFIPCHSDNPTYKVENIRSILQYVKSKKI